MNNNSVVTKRTNSPFALLKSGLIVSCQVPDGTAIDTPAFIAAQALTVIQAGAIGIRAQGIANVTAISQVVQHPIIGLVKRYDDSSPIFITPAISDVVELEAAGANIVAIDATERMRPGQQSFEDFITQLRLESNVAILADVDSLESALIAHSLGCEAVATTLSGYTDQPAPGLPDIKLIQQIANQMDIPIIAEGGFSKPESVKEAFEAGAWSVCIGTAITNPFLLTQKFLTNLI